MSNLFKLKADEIYAIYGLIDIANAKTSKRYAPLPIILPLRSKL